MNNKVWICGQLIGEWEETGSKWSFQGVFTSKELAITACKNERYFIFSAEINEELPSENLLPPDGQYPVIENALIKETK